VIDNIYHEEKERFNQKYKQAIDRWKAKCEEVLPIESPQAILAGPPKNLLKH